MEGDGKSRMKEDPQIAAMNKLAREHAGSQVDDVGMSAAAGDDAGPDERKDVPWIELPGVGRPLKAFAGELAAVCAMNGVYRRGMDIVTVNRETNAIEPMDKHDFMTYVEDLAVTYKWTAGGKNQPPVRSETTMTAEASIGVLKSRHFIFRQRPLERVNSVPQPIMRKDGRIELLQPGYDEESGILTKDAGIEIYEMPLEGAKMMLRTLYKHFPFVSPLDLAIQISSMLSYFGALLLPLNAERINFALKANKHRSGKTLLIKCALVPVTGRCEVDAWPDTPADLSQLLNSVVNDGLAYLVLDDITGHVKSTALNAFLTANWWSFRGYYTQSKKSGMKQAVVFLSGHEMTLQADLEGRFLECRLHVEEADSHAHKVPNPINERWLARPEQRRDICSALWSIIKAWDAAGRPKGKSMKPGFEEWCSVFGGIVEFAGFGDPCLQRPDEERSDNEYSDMAELLGILFERFAEGEREKEFTFADLVETCVNKNLLTWKTDGQWKTSTVKGKDGKEWTERWYQASKRAESALGLLFADKYGGTLFTVRGTKLRFGNRGKNRTRRYTISVVS